MTSSAAVRRSLRNVRRVAIGVPPFAVGHLARTRHLDRVADTVDAFTEQPPPVPFVDDVQRAEDGVGPCYMRTFTVRTRGASKSAEQLLDAFRRRPDDFVDRRVAAFRDDDGRPVGPIVVGERFRVEIPGPWPALMYVVQTRPSVVLATRSGHLEAGVIRFSAWDVADDSVVFQIRSWARAGDLGFAALHIAVPVGREFQTALWSSMCDAACGIAGGRRSGPITIRTERLADSATV